MTEADAREKSEHGGPEGLAGTFHEKVISFDTMELRLLLPTAVAIAVVIASAVLLGMRDFAWPLVSAGTVTGSVLGTVPLPIAVLTGVTLILAWSFVLAGALHAHLAFRILGVGSYTVVGLTSAGEADAIFESLTIVLIVLSVVVAAIGLYITDRGNHRQAPQLHHRVRLRLPTFGWILLATTLIYVMVALRGVRNGYFAEFIQLQLSALQFVLIPVLLLAGTDFTEWSEVLSGRISSLLERLPRTALVVAVAAAAAAALFWAYVIVGGRPGFSLSGTVRNLAPVVILAVPVCAVGGLGLTRKPSTQVPFWALAIGAVTVYLGIFGGAFAGSVPFDSTASPDLPPLVHVQHPGDPSYTLLVPQSWHETSVPGGRAWAGSEESGRPSRLVLLWAPAGEGALASALGVPVDLGRAGPDGGWQRSAVSTTLAGRPAQGDLWTRQAEGRSWMLAGITAGRQTQSSRAIFDAVRASWSPDVSTEAGASETDFPPQYDATWVGAASVVLLVLGLILLLTGRDEVVTGGLFLTLCGLFTAAGPLVASKVLQILGAGDNPPAVVTDNLLVTGAYAALAGMLLTSIVPRWRLPVPVLRLLFVLLLGFACLQVLYEGVFGTALSAGERFSLIQGVVLVAAMLWDVLMSGESFTNTGGLAVPRHSRVLIYLGYTLMVVTTVLFLSSLRVQGGGGAGQEFESDTWPQLGIAALGPPLLLTFFFVNLSAWRRSRPMGRAAGLDQVDRAVLNEGA